MVVAVVVVGVVVGMCVLFMAAGLVALANIAIVSFASMELSGGRYFTICWVSSRFTCTPCHPTVPNNTMHMFVFLVARLGGWTSQACSHYPVPACWCQYCALASAMRGGAKGRCAIYPFLFDAQRIERKL